MTARQHYALRAFALGVILALQLLPRGEWQKSHDRAPVLATAASAADGDPSAFVANR